MPANPSDLDALFMYRDLRAPWFFVQADLPYPQLKRHLKLLHRLSGELSPTLDELEALSAQEIHMALLFYQQHTKSINPKPVMPTDAAQFYQYLMTQSLYVIEVIPYSDALHQRLTQSKNTVSAATEASPEGLLQKNAPVHGFPLQEHEAFSATRYYSDDKSSYAQIIVKDGVMRAIYQQLTPEQETDLAWEMSFRHLINLPPDRKSVTINGAPPMIHRLHAAFIALQRQAAPRYDHVTLNMPDEFSRGAEALDDDYLKQYLGPSPTSSQHMLLWDTFIKMKDGTPIDSTDILNAFTASTPQKNSNVPLVPLIQWSNPPLKQSDGPKTLAELKDIAATSTKKYGILKIDDIIAAEGLSDGEKLRLYDYSVFLFEVWLVMPGDSDTSQPMAQYEEFAVRTEAALFMADKAPHLYSDFSKLAAIYNQDMEAYQELAEAESKNKRASFKQVKETRSPREGLNICIKFINDELQRTSYSRQEQQPHLDAMKTIASNTKPTALELSNVKVECYYAMVNDALSFLASKKDYSNDSSFKTIHLMAAAYKEQTSPSPTGACVKKRQQDFQKKLMESRESTVTISELMKEDLDYLMILSDQYIENSPIIEGQHALKQLSSLAKKISTSDKIHKANLDTLNQHINKALPYLETHLILKDHLKTMQESIKTFNRPDVTEDTNLRPQPRL